MVHLTRNLVIKSPMPGKVYLHGDEVLLQISTTDSLPDNFKLCFLHGNFQTPPSSKNKIHCFQRNLLQGRISSLPIGFHRFSVYIDVEGIGVESVESVESEDDVIETAVLVHTHFQVLGFAPLDSDEAESVTTGIWHCQNDKHCKYQLVNMVNKIRSAGEATAATANPNGFGIYVEKQLIPQYAALELIALAERCDFDLTALDTVDKKPSMQLDLWHHKSGVPSPDLNSLRLTTEIYRSVLPNVLQKIQALHPWAKENMTCTDAFVRRYRPGERIGVKAHQDTSELTVNCLLSSTDLDFEGGFVYRWDDLESKIDIVPLLQGDCVFHAGSVKHGATPTLSGTRYTFIMFWTLNSKLRGSSTFEQGETNPGLEDKINVDGKIYVREL